VRAWGRRFGDERGLALVAVLWIATILALLAAVFLRESRGRLALTHNLVEEAKAEALAEAGVNRTMLILLGLDNSVPWRVDGGSFAFDLVGGTVRVTVQDEGGRIDLNRAADTVLKGLFTSNGVDADRAQALADAIADFRDADDLRRINGAEDADYAQAKLPADAKDAPFATIEELQQVYGMTADLYRQVAPLVTVYSPRRDVNLATAPAAVLRALPYLSAERVSAILEQRGAGDGTVRRFRVIAVSLLVEAATADGGRVIREVVLRRSNDAARPFDIVRWRRRWPSEFAQ
jgi:general secretion pathway protein K